MKHASFMRRTLTLLFAALLFLFPVTAMAAEGEPTPAEPVSESAPGDAGVTEEGTEGLPASAVFVDFLEDHAAELLAGATFLLTLFVSLVFKKKLIPSLLEGLSALLGKGRAALDTITEKQSAEGERIDALFSEIGALLADAHDAAARAEEAAELIKKREDTGEALTEVLTAEAELLFSLLASANLPQYEKDRVAAVYARIADRLGSRYE